MFSGYSERELESGRFPASSAADGVQLWPEIRSCLDFAVLGRYNALRAAADPLVTSSNQRMVLFSSRYHADHFSEPTVEVSIDESGLTQITGFPILGSLSAA
jgi:hypothetical protein